MPAEVAILLLVFLGIPTLIRWNVISVEYRLFLLFGAFLAIAALGFFTLPLPVMGLTMQGWVQDILPWAATTMVMIFGIVAAAMILRYPHAEDPLHDPHFLFLFIPISIVQQFMYQSVLLQKLIPVFDPWVAIAICGLCFGYMHTIFPRRWSSFLLTVCGGVIFSLTFYLYPNFLFATLSHMVLNFIAVYLGFFTLLDKDSKPRATRLRSVKALKDV